MAKSFVLPSRQVHLDFHTSPAIGDVGANFDPKAFARAFKEANVNSVTVFAKCHHGHLYYNTKRPERHPGLKKGLDLLAGQVDALHAEGIRAPIYISIQCDEYAANTHPEWVARKADGGQMKWGTGVFSPAWQILDMSTDYQEYLAEQTQEVLKLFKPVDGIFFDMCWDQPSTTAPFIAQMIKANLNPELEADRAKYAHTLALAYMKRFYQMVKGASKDGSVYFNSRPLSNMAEEIPFQAQVEIEALPTGGWGYMYFPKNVRFARTFNRDYLGMTARFHKSWGDFGSLKPDAALEYETSQMMAHGAKCSIGDQLHPRGNPDKATYQLIGRAYGRVAAREPWLEGAKPVTDIGLFQVPATDYNPIGGSDEGATRMLTQLKQQFDVVLPHGDWSKYRLLVLPDSITVDANLAKRLSAYVKAGGAILASGTSGLNADGTAVTFPLLGVKPKGWSPFTTTYCRFGKRINQQVADAEHVMYDKSVRVIPGVGAISLATIVEPYFERAWDHFCSHNQTPYNQPSKFSAAVLKGRVAYIAYPIFRSFANHANVPCRQLVQNILSLLLPDPLLTVKAPTSTEATVMQQKSEGRTIIHLLQYCPERRTKDLDIVEDIVPIYEIPLSLRLAKKPKSVYMAPDRLALAFDYADGRLQVTVPEVNGHAMVVVE